MNRMRRIVLGLSVALLLFQSGAVAGQRSEGRQLVGTWEVVLRFPVCNMQCLCPGGTPNIPIPVLQTYSADGTMIEIAGGSLFRGPSAGVWSHVQGDEYVARHVFYVFNPDGTRRLKEVVTVHIELQGQDAFAGSATFDLFAADGTPISSECQINATATRLEAPER